MFFAGLRGKTSGGALGKHLKKARRFFREGNSNRGGGGISRSVCKGGGRVESLGSLRPLVASSRESAPVKPRSFVGTSLLPATKMQRGRRGNDSETNLTFDASFQVFYWKDVSKKNKEISTADAGSERTRRDPASGEPPPASFQMFYVIQIKKKIFGGSKRGGLPTREKTACGLRAGSDAHKGGATHSETLRLRGQNNKSNF